MDARAQAAGGEAEVRGGLVDREQADRALPCWLTHRFPPCTWGRTTIRVALRFLGLLGLGRRSRDQARRHSTGSTRNLDSCTSWVASCDSERFSVP